MLTRIVFLLVFACGIRSAAEEPWSVAAGHPVVAKTAGPMAPPAFRTTGEITARGWIAFYQQYLSVFIQSQCRMLPSCSAYGLQAIDRHGALVGIVMTADRLLHEGDEQRLNRFVRTAGVSYCPDPVSNNDFWWAHD
jgi:putative component of membrane protein insertase Oxa1/YidC/SpoIIIJ protein YidD